MPGVDIHLDIGEAEALQELFRLAEMDERFREHLSAQPMLSVYLMKVLDKLELGLRKAGGH